MAAFKAAERDEDRPAFVVRRSVYPFAEMSDGSVHVAWPNWIADPAESFVRALSSDGVAPGERATAEDARRAFDVAGMATAGSLVADAPRGALRAGMAGAKNSPAPPLPRELDDLGFYSAALESAKGLQQAKGTPEQMISQIMKAPGVKQNEIEALGLKAAFEGRPSLSRDEVIDYIRQNRVQAREGRYSDADNSAGILALVRGDGGKVAGRAKWSNYSLDPSNPTYRETVVHLPPAEARFDDLVQKRNAMLDQNEGADVTKIQAEINRLKVRIASGEDLNFQSGHWSEPNVIGHARTSLHDDGKGGKTFLVGELQSDWGQRLREDGLRDEAKIAELKARRLQANEALDSAITRIAIREGRESDIRDATSEQYYDFIDEFDDELRPLLDAENLADAELLNAIGAVSAGHPLVNTTDQWVNTMLRRMLRQAVDDGATSIAIPSGKTVDSYGMGAPLNGLEYAYDQMYPKNLRNILKKLDPAAAEMTPVSAFRLSNGQEGGTGVAFPITDKVRQSVAAGQPLFANPSTANIVTMMDDERRRRQEISDAWWRGDAS